MTAILDTAQRDSRPATPLRWRHASGEDDGCAACWEERFLATYPGDRPGVCREPDPDPDEPDRCALCSHGVETAPAA